MRVSMVEITLGLHTDIVEPVEVVTTRDPYKQPALDVDVVDTTEPTELAHTTLGPVLVWMTRVPPTHPLGEVVTACGFGSSA